MKLKQFKTDLTNKIETIKQIILTIESKILKNNSIHNTLGYEPINNDEELKLSLYESKHILLKINQLKTDLNTEIDGIYSSIDLLDKSINELSNFDESDNFNDFIMKKMNEIEELRKQMHNIVNYLDKKKDSANNPDDYSNELKLLDELIEMISVDNNSLPGNRNRNNSDSEFEGGNISPIIDYNDNTGVKNSLFMGGSILLGNSKCIFMIICVLLIMYLIYIIYQQINKKCSQRQIKLISDFNVRPIYI